MASLSNADHTVDPPRVTFPRDYNAAHDLLERNSGRAAKIAYIDAAGSHTYGKLEERALRVQNALAALGLGREDRIMLALLDTVDFPAVFLGAIRGGIVPVAANTLLTTADFEFMLRDSRAKALVVSAALLPAFTPILGQLASLKQVIVAGGSAHTHPSPAGIAPTSGWSLPRRGSAQRRWGARTTSDRSSAYSPTRTPRGASSARPVLRAARTCFHPGFGVSAISQD